MDTHAARRARQKAIKADLMHAYTDEEATPPEWVDLLNQVRDATQRITADIARETDAFVSEPDIRNALARRERVATRLREEIEALNKTVHRLNLLVPNARFTRPAIKPDEVLRPLFRSERRSRDSAV